MSGSGDVSANIAAFKAKMAAGKGAQTGGKGSVRRKRKAKRKSTSQDDKRLQSQLKKLTVNNIPAIEEVNLFRNDDTVVHFPTPRVQASIAANTYVVSGTCEVKKVVEMIPQILPQLGPDNLENLKNFATQFQQSKAAGQEDEDDVPALVENVNFEEVATGGAAAADTKD